MRLRVSKMLLAIIIVFAFGSIAPSYTFAIGNDPKMVRLNDQLKTIFDQIDNNGEASSKSVKNLEEILKEFGVDTSLIGEDSIQEDSGMVTTMGFGQNHDLGKGWKVIFHRPHGSEATQYHAHVKGKVNGKTVESKEALDGSSTHGKGNTMNDKKIPKSIQKKVKEHPDFKKAKAEEAQAKKAAKQMKTKKLDFKKVANVTIGIGIFVAVVGIMLFAPTAIVSWAAVFIFFVGIV